MYEEEKNKCWTNKIQLKKITKYYLWGIFFSVSPRLIPCQPFVSDPEEEHDRYIRDGP